VDVDSFIRGIESTKKLLGSFVDFLSADLRDSPDDTYLARVYFNCEIHQIISSDAINLCNFDLLEKVGAFMAEQLAQAIRKTLFAAKLGVPGPKIAGIETMLDSSLPEGVVLMHPKTFNELFRRFRGSEVI